MKKALKRILIVLMATVAVVLAVLPIVLPPLVSRIAEAKLAELGFLARVRMDLGYVWSRGPELAGVLRLNLVDSPVEARADFGVGLGTWHAQLTVPETEMTESDPTVGRILTDNPLPKGLSNLTFRATISLTASAERTLRVPVPVWSAKMPIRLASAAFVKDGKPVSVSALSVRPGISGIAGHRDISPLFLRVSAADVQGFTLTNLTASIRATERSLLVTEAKAGVCGGTLSLYSLFLDPKTLDAGFTLFMENIDAGEMLGHIRGFRGEASGSLHGKLRLFLKEGGRSLRFSNGFLYSTPGEAGKLKMTDTEIITGNLALAGIDTASRRNVANALADLDYTVLKLDLRRIGGEDATLGVRLSGSATRGSQTAPVDLTVNINGKLEQILNTGLGLSERLKGTKK